MYKAFREGDFARAHELHRVVAALSNVYAIETPYFGTLKEAARLCGLPDLPTHVLRPSQPLSEQGKAKLRALLESCGLL